MKDLFFVICGIAIFLNVLCLLYNILIQQKKRRTEQELERAMDGLCDICIHNPEDCESCIGRKDL